MRNVRLKLLSLFTLSALVVVLDACSATAAPTVTPRSPGGGFGRAGGDLDCRRATHSIPADADTKAETNPDACIHLYPHSFSNARTHHRPNGLSDAHGPADDTSR